MDDEASSQTAVRMTKGQAAAEPPGGHVGWRRLRQYGFLALSFVLGAWLSDVIVAVAHQVGLGGQDIFPGAEL